MAQPPDADPDTGNNDRDRDEAHELGVDPVRIGAQTLDQLGDDADQIIADGDDRETLDGLLQAQLLAGALVHRG